MGASKLFAAKKTGRFVSALADSNQVKYMRIFLSFLNSELCPGVTQCPKLCPIYLRISPKYEVEA